MTGPKICCDKLRSEEGVKMPPIDQLVRQQGWVERHWRAIEQGEVELQK